MEEAWYPPSEDTFLLMDALELDKELIRRTVGVGPEPCCCLELGSGSGAVLESLIQIIGPRAIYFATDVNHRAAVATFARNKSVAEVIVTHLADGMVWKRMGGVRIALFNPPYVPTDEEEYLRAIQRRDIFASWAGGHRGRQVIDAVLDTMDEWLAPHGLFYLVVSDVNGLQEVTKRAYALDCQCDVVISRNAGDLERLHVLRLEKHR
mmetsp:Transcript_2748/g.5009  ORF Transcript_2748/g.5009 Transcript_2748/m.5009 type:complete len:208 (-) Transcript_2748:722-1345(-)